MRAEPSPEARAWAAQQVAERGPMPDRVADRIRPVIRAANEAAAKAAAECAEPHRPLSRLAEVAGRLRPVFAHRPEPRPIPYMSGERPWTTA